MRGIRSSSGTGKRRTFDRSCATGWARLLLTALLLTSVCVVARAEDLVWATGRVSGSDGKPLSGALVAVYDEKNKVVDYARTDQNGEYALAVPKRVLNLSKRGKGFFAEVVGGITRFVGGAAGFVANPLRAGVSAVTSGQVAATIDPITRGGIAAGGALADQLLFSMKPQQRRPTLQEERKMPGALVVKVAMPGKNDLVGVTRVYWMQQETFKAGGKQTKTLAAWLDPVQLTPAESETPSLFQTEYMQFKAARIEPSIAEPGQLVRLRARFATPPEPQVNIVVVARNSRTGQKWELTDRGDGLYEAEVEIDKRFPRDDQIITLVAYAAVSQTPGRRKDAEGAIEGAGLFDPKKSYVYNPLLVVSRNRAEVVLTVLSPQKRGR